MDKQIPEILRKTATLLRSQELEKSALKKKAEDLEKESAVNRTVLNMIKGEMIDVSDIDAKIAEFNGNPDLLKQAIDFYEKTADIGAMKDAPSFGEVGKAEENFINSLL